MKVGLIADFFGNPDEGMKNTAFHLAEELSKHCEVLPLNGRRVFYRDFWKAIKGFHPNVIHYVSGPSLLSFIIVKLLSLYCRNTKTVMSAMHLSLPGFSRRFIPFLKPDLILTQSYETEKMLIELGCKTAFFPGGIDVDRFTTALGTVKEELREKYGIDKGKFIILHVGNIRKGRNVEALNNLQGEDRQVIIVGSTSVGIEKNAYRDLEKEGCLVLTGHFEKIEEIYALSDCYVFPVPPANKLNSIELPLSVMEAMACNLPVITTRFGALTRVFDQGQGLIYIDSDDDFLPALRKIRDMEVTTRDKVLSYSWENVTRRLEGIYADTLAL